jgi:uncharacterized repeat protein (TIGR03806 family)
MWIVGVMTAMAAGIGVMLQPERETQAKDPPIKRVPWTTSKVRGSPDPPSPYKVEVSFANLKFDEPLDITTGRGSDRLFVTERFGRIYSIPNDPTVAKPDLMLDLNEVFSRTTPKSLATYGLALHPKFAENGFIYVTIVPDPSKEEPKGTRVSRFKSTGNPPRCDPKSELVLIEWASGGHNGGCLEFGPDGFLYIATGDASGIADQYMTGQDMTSLAGKILRIDVDHTDGAQKYRVPKDNPFVGQANTRPEIWCYGLRQPWKMSFDRATGDFWGGNIGQDLWEQIYLYEKGGNYGWSILEGSHPFRPERPRGPSPILMPVVEHDHANFRSITGGHVYHGKRLKDLIGAYIYGDYDTGRIWMFRYDRAKKTASENRELVDSTLRLIDFAETSDGELHLLDHMTGRIYRLVPNPAINNAADFPRKLSDTGLFASTKDHQTAPGVVPYTVIAPQWIDGASKERFVALPGNSQIEFDAMLYPNAQGAPPGWKFPDGTVLVETISLDTTAGKRRIETRILHHERLTGTEEVGDQYWQGYTYIWNDEQTDAVLLEDPQGRDRAFMVKDSNSPQGRQQTWHFPSRTECITCHNMAAKYAVGLQTLQMNTHGQLERFDAMGMFTKPLPAHPDTMQRLANYHDPKHDLNLRARSYLHANCSHCHRRWGGGNAEFQLIATWDLGEMGIVNVRPSQGTFNIPGARLVVPGDPYRSVLFYRTCTVGSGRMPRLGSSVVDEAGVRLIHNWIAKMPGTGLVSAPSPLGVDPLSDTSAALKQAHMLGIVRNLDSPIVKRGAGSDVPEIRDLFERFLPEQQRVKRLGSVVRPEQILAIPGDIDRGRRLFFDGQGVQCRNCHRIGGKGIEVGPDLDAIGKKYTRSQILENILDPSRQIEPKYLSYFVETKSGKMHRGLLVSRDSAKVVLKSPENKLIEVKSDDIDRLVSEQKSIMPDLLLRDLTAEQVADLTAFLWSLK